MHPEFEIHKMLGLSINNGECIELLKEEQERIKEYLENPVDNSHKNVTRQARM